MKKCLNFNKFFNHIFISFIFQINMRSSNIFKVIRNISLHYNVSIKIFESSLKLVLVIPLNKNLAFEVAEQLGTLSIMCLATALTICISAIIYDHPYFCIWLHSQLAFSTPRAIILKGIIKSLRLSVYDLAILPFLSIWLIALILFYLE